jgi:CrcB protein
VSLPVALGIGLLGGIGALARFLLDAAVADRFGRGFPLGTLAVNLTGALALGVLVGAAVSSDTLRLVGTGLIGSYTTFSTWVLESQRLGEDGQARLGALNLLVSLFAGIAMAWLGRKLGMAL